MYGYTIFYGIDLHGWHSLPLGVGSGFFNPRRPLLRCYSDGDPVLTLRADAAVSIFESGTRS